ncbi:phage tail protein [Lelliottia nimipressuralis]|jgi:P2 phage tail completion protein R (GpR).|uniref:Phage tail protein n=1 Tax=Lelliottia nimipressuralis TaxID=69220 RepID=A0ABY3P7K3_9ENTR|nr:phage tail protein [Lelliottia nimipressuralis]RXJ11460.1 phage tail protein [Lelliottia nimipressuralis]TYT35713.1 phage tail protein [Lelliottia nimipressuralis]
MNKPNSLRQALIDAIPQLSAHPEMLRFSVENGNIDARLSVSLSFEKKYTLKGLVKNFVGESNQLFVPLLAWLRENQPDIFTLDEGRKNGYLFQIVMNDDESKDISFSLQLTERILVTEENGTLRASYSPEPPLPAPVTRPKELYINGELVSQWSE